MMRLSLIFGVLFAPKLLVWAQEPTPTPTIAPWTGCTDPAFPDQKITIGEKTLVCLQIGAGVPWNVGIEYIRLSFSPVADQYSRLYIPNSYGDIVANSTGTIWQNKNVTVGTAAGTFISFLRLYSDTTNNKIYPFLTAIINVDNGVVTGITWDDACVFCPNRDCDEITYDYNGDLQTQQTSGQPSAGCFLETSSCKDRACDLLLYVVWTGTDSGGRAFQSSAYRFSAFPKQDWGDTVNDIIPGLGGRRAQEVLPNPITADL